MIRTGKVLSAKNETKLRAAADHMDRAIDHVRGVLATTNAGGDIGSNTTLVQTSSGNVESNGSEGGRALSADFRRRQAQLLALSEPR